MASVLFVEDDVLVRHLLGKVLASDGHEVMACGSLREAEAAFTQTDVDLALLDIGLPDGSGIDCARALRKRGFAGPLIYLTAMSDQATIEAAQGLGAYTYLVKPIGAQQLLPAVRTALNTAEAVQDQQERMKRALLRSREISTAVGILAERNAGSVEQAFERLRQQARQQQRPIEQVAAELLAQRAPR